MKQAFIGFFPVRGRCTNVRNRVSRRTIFSSCEHGTASALCVRRDKDFPVTDTTAGMSGMIRGLTLAGLGVIAGMNGIAQAGHGHYGHGHGGHHHHHHGYHGPRFGVMFAPPPVVVAPVPVVAAPVPQPYPVPAYGYPVYAPPVVYAPPPPPVGFGVSTRNFSFFFGH